MSQFSISAFQEPQQFVALYLGLFSHPHLSTLFLKRLIQRTKSPSIALTYTQQFLSQQSEQETSLSIIRFISQLSDVSSGVSMSSSLFNVLSESSLLTELRHSLTHKTMVKGTIIQVSKSLILDGLKRKYWDIVFEEYDRIYVLNSQKILTYYQAIFHQEYKGEYIWNQTPFTGSWQDFLNLENYQFKQQMSAIIEALNQKSIEATLIIDIFTHSAFLKQKILLHSFLAECLQINTNSMAFKAAQELVKISPIQLLQDELINQKLREFFFLQYLNSMKSILCLLPSAILDRLKQFWQEKALTYGQLYSMN